MASAQQCHALITYFIKAYTQTKGVAPVLNRNKSRWGFDSILMDYTSDEVRQMIDFYLKYYTARGDVEWFLFNYEKVDEDMKDHEQKKLAKQEALRETARRAEEWRNRWQH